MIVHGVDLGFGSHELFSNGLWHLNCFTVLNPNGPAWPVSMRMNEMELSRAVVISVQDTMS